MAMRLQNVRQGFSVMRRGLPPLPEVTIEYRRWIPEPSLLRLETKIIYDGPVRYYQNGVLSNLSSFGGSFTIDQPVSHSFNLSDTSYNYGNEES